MVRIQDMSGIILKLSDEIETLKKQIGVMNGQQEENGDKDINEERDRGWNKPL